MDDAQLFESLAAHALTDPRVGRAKSFGTSSLRVGDKVYAMVYRGALVLKLPRDRVLALIDAGIGRPFEMGSRVMKEWVALPEGSGDWPALSDEACDFVWSLANTAKRR